MASLEIGQAPQFRRILRKQLAVAPIVQLNSGATLWNPPMSKSRLPKLQLVQAVTGPAAERPSGRVTHDSRGNAVWDWAISTGVLARKSVAELLKTLDEPGMLKLDSDPESRSDWSGDPYNRSDR